MRTAVGFFMPEWGRHSSRRESTASGFLPMNFYDAQNRNVCILQRFLDVSELGILSFENEICLGDHDHASRWKMFSFLQNAGLNYHKRKAQVNHENGNSCTAYHALPVIGIRKKISFWRRVVCIWNAVLYTDTGCFYRTKSACEARKDSKTIFI
jgi:hypothetical protein